MKTKVKGVPLEQWCEKNVDKSGPPNKGEFIYVDIASIDRESKVIVSPKFLPVEKAPSRAKQHLEAGDVIVSMTRPNRNAVAIIPKKLDGAIASTGFHILRATSDNLPKFLFYAVQTQGFIKALCDKVQGVLYPAVKAKDISSFILHPFSLSYQRSVVARIEELFSALDAGEQSLRDARQQLTLYRQSLLKQAFEGKLTEQWRANNPDKLEPPETLLTRIQQERESRHQQQLQTWQQAVEQWEENGKEGKKPTKPAKLQPIEATSTDEKLNPSQWLVVEYGKLCSLVRNGLSKKPTGDSGHKICRISAVRPMFFDYSDYRYLDCDESKRAAYALTDGDLVFTRYNGARRYVGVCAYYNGKEPRLYPDKLIRTSPTLPSLDSHFLEYSLNTGISRKYIESKIRTTAGQSGISGGDVKGIPTLICPLPEQQEIVRLLDEQFTAIEQNEKEIDYALTQSQALRQSILKKAFEGSLVAQDSEDESASELLERIQRDAQSSKIVTKPKKKVAKKKSAKIPVGATDLQAGLVALAAQAHQEKNVFFGHTKAEKFIHLASALSDLDLWRIPRQEASGPNDFPRAKKVEHRARMKKWFNTKKEGEIYHYHIGPNSTQLIEATKQKLGHNLDIIQKLLQEVLKMDTRQAEIFATVYAAWNNLLIQDKPTDEESIVTAAREEWHENKLNIGRQKFFAAILWIRGHGFAPTGSGRLVIKPDLT